MTTIDRLRRPRVSRSWFPFVLLLSFVVMIPWPVIGIALSQSLFDNAWEACFLFGGLTAIPGALLSLLFGDFSNEGFAALLLIVWGLFVLVPPSLLFATRPTRALIATTLLLQSLFSLAQAALGALMILGKDV